SSVVSMLPPAPVSSLCPYTTLFRSVDFSFLRSRISGSIDYYRTTTNDLLFRVNIPEITGFNDIMTNVGEVANRGLELMLNSRVKDRKSTRLNSSHVKSSYAVFCLI